MTDQPPLPPGPSPEQLPPPVEPQPRRDPFWSYVDLVVFIGAALPSLLLGLGIVKLVYWVLRWHPKNDALVLLPAQALGYMLLFGVLVAIFRTYGQPFWHSIGWVTPALPSVLIVGAGWGAAIGVAVIGTLIRTPQSENDITKLLKDPMSIVLMAIFGVLIAPACEELAFRGFLQPLLVRSFGVWPGVLGAAVPFGLLHFREYGNSWKHALIISMAGAAFGWMRQAARSTLASALMHASYNGLVFAMFLAARSAGKA